MIAETLLRLSALQIPGLDILVIDDNSPDGTAAIVEKLAYPNLTILKRPRKEGLGPAYLAAFRWGLERNYDLIIEMDADGSHQPEELPRLLEAAQEADLVLGTRWMIGGKVLNWPLHRRLISRLGTWYAELALKLPYKDLTGGFRAYRGGLLNALDLSQVSTLGYGFQVEMALRSAQSGAIIREVPITFIERREGASKMSRAIVVEAFLKTTEWGFQRWLNRR